MEEANNVQLSDTRNWNLAGLKSYISIALPSMVYLMIDWSVMDSLIIIAGYLSFID